MVYYRPISGPANYTVKINNVEYAFSSEQPDFPVADLTAGGNTGGNTGGNFGGGTGGGSTGDVIQWVPGSTQVQNVTGVTYNGKCFVAQNSPGVWESPTQNNLFWKEVTCPQA